MRQPRRRVNSRALQPVAACATMPGKMKNGSRFARWTRRVAWGAAAVFVVQCIMALTGPPRALVDWLTCENLKPQETPRTIVVLGGGGIPSTSSLIRLYYAAEYGRNMTGTTFVVSLPSNIDPERASVGRMRDELVMRGIPASRIRMETRGLGTRDEAVKVRELLGEATIHEPVVVVSSEFHLRRAVLAFRRAGFSNVRGLYADNIGAEADFRFAGLRYGVWNNLSRQAAIMRELIALAVYKVCGWA